LTYIYKNIHGNILTTDREGEQGGGKENGGGQTGSGDRQGGGGNTEGGDTGRGTDREGGHREGGQTGRGYGQGGDTDRMRGALVRGGAAVVRASSRVVVVVGAPCAL
jgi:hypothetical protein